MHQLKFSLTLHKRHSSAIKENNVNTTAKTIQCACKANLILVGVEDGQPQWMGTQKEWAEFERLLAWVDEYNSYA